MKIFNNTISLLFIGSVFMLFFSSCMHMMMMGGHGEHDSTDLQIEKHITQGNIFVRAVIPVFKQKEEQTITIEVQFLDTQQPVTNAEVIFHFMHIAPDSEHNYHKTRNVENTMVNGKAKEILSGKYSFTITPSTEGKYSLSVRVSVIGADTLQSPIELEVLRTITMQHNMGMMGMGTATTYTVIGAVLMSAMMVTMWAVRGWHF